MCVAKGQSDGVRPELNLFLQVCNCKCERDPAIYFELYTTNVMRCNVVGGSLPGTNRPTSTQSISLRVPISSVQCLPYRSPVTGVKSTYAFYLDPSIETLNNI